MGNEIWQEKAYLPGMAAIATGVLTALGCARWKPSRVVGVGCFALGTAGLLTIWFGEGWWWKLVGDSSLLILTTSAALLLVAGTRWPTWNLPRMGAMLSTIRSWGRLSYEIYLTHMFVVYGFVRLARGMTSDPTSGLWTYVVVPPICWGLGLATERVLSTPSRRRLLVRWQGTAAAEAISR